MPNRLLASCWDIHWRTWLIIGHFSSNSRPAISSNHIRAGECSQIVERFLMTLPHDHKSARMGMSLYPLLEPRIPPSQRNPWTCVAGCSGVRPDWNQWLWVDHRQEEWWCLGAWGPYVLLHGHARTWQLQIAAATQTIDAKTVQRERWASHQPPALKWLNPLGWAICEWDGVICRKSDARKVLQDLNFFSPVLHELEISNYNSITTCNM